MKKIALLLPAVLLSFGAFASPGSADDGTDANQPVGDPGIAALHNAVTAFRELRATEDACRGAEATEQCKDARSEARAVFQTVRADAIVAHHEFRDRLQTWKDAKTPEDKAAAVTELKAQAEEAKAIIEAHRDDVTALRGRLNDELARLDPKAREEHRKDAKVLEQSAREKNTAELTVRLRDAGKRGTPGTTPSAGTRPLSSPKVTGAPEIRAPKGSSPTEIHPPTPTSSPAR